MKEEIAGLNFAGVDNDGVIDAVTTLLCKKLSVIKCSSSASYEYVRILCQLLYVIIQYADNANHVAEGKYIDKNTHLKRTRITHSNC